MNSLTGKKSSEYTESKKVRPIEEKERWRWLETLERRTQDIPEGINVITVCDREGDRYELFCQAETLRQPVLIRVVQKRMMVEHKRILEEIQKRRCPGRVEAAIPRDSRSGIPEREAVVQLRYTPFTIRRPHILNPVKTLSESIEVTVIYVKEEHPPQGNKPIEWFLMTSEPVTSPEEAYEYVGYYIQRWKIEQRTLPRKVDTVKRLVLS